MGFIQQSSDKKIYAYLTQLGKEKILNATSLDDFNIKFFSLHDDDINYKISSKQNGLNYNIPESGFIPNITGDDESCSPNISKSFKLKNKLTGYIEPQPPQPPDPDPEPQPLGAKVIAYCELDDGNDPLDPNLSDTIKPFFQTGLFSIAIESPSGGTNEGYKWYVVREIISFPNSNSITPIVLASAQSETFNYSVDGNGTGNAPQSFITTFYDGESYSNDSIKFPINSNGNGLIKKWIFSQPNNDYKQRIADAFNFLVYLEDSSGTKKLIQKFENINCSQRLFGIQIYRPYDNDTFPIKLRNYRNYPNLFNLNNSSNLNRIKSVVLFVLDKGNRRNDLNITSDDLLYINTLNYFIELREGNNTLIINYKIKNNEIEDNSGDPNNINYFLIKNRQLVNGEIIETSSLSSSLILNIVNGGPNIFYDNASNDLYKDTPPSSPPSNLSNIRFDPLQPKVSLFENLKLESNNNSFTIHVIEFQRPNANFPFNTNLLTSTDYDIIKDDFNDIDIDEYTIQPLIKTSG